MKFCKSYAFKAAAKNRLLRKDAKFDFNDDCVKSFTELKNTLINAPALRFIDRRKPFIVTVDASTAAIGYTLEQEDENGVRHPCIYGGRALFEAERNNSIIKLEGLALVSAIQEWSAYLQHQPFIVETDNISLTWLSKINGSSGRLGIHRRIASVVCLHVALSGLYKRAVIHSYLLEMSLRAYRSKVAEIERNTSCVFVIERVRVRTVLHRAI
jgi:hypothetical protein